MNKIVKFKVFESYNLYGSRSLTKYEFDNLLEENCQNWILNNEKYNYTPIYRGQPDLGKYVFTDPTRYHRSSIEDTNLHLELIDNLPSWNEYPKYSKSVIGISRSKSLASNYSEDDNTVYEVIPYDNIKIAVCPSSTIWASLGISWGEYIYLIQSFLNYLEIEEDWNQPNGGTIETRLKSLKKDDIDFKHKFLDEIVEITGIKKEDITGEDCYYFINDFLFNPDVNEFELIKYTKGFNIKPDKQIWTNGPVLLKSV